MISTLDETDLDWLTLIDYEKELSCEWTFKDCSQKPEWKITIKCCGHSYLLCTAHKNEEILNVESLGPLINCSICKKVKLISKAEDHITITPI